MRVAALNFITNKKIVDHGSALLHFCFFTLLYFTFGSIFFSLLRKFVFAPLKDFNVLVEQGMSFQKLSSGFVINMLKIEFWS